MAAETNQMLKKVYIAIMCLHATAFAQDIKLNQIGFYPSGDKIAILPDVQSGDFQITSTDGQTVHHTGTIVDGGNWSHSGEDVGIADFTDFVTPGTYIVKAGSIESYPFEIQENVHQALSVASLKAYYYNRCSMTLESQYAGIYAREGGHWDTDVLIHESAVSPGRPESFSISSPKGWYDAGDYNKYIVNSGISTYTLLAAYEYFPDYYDQLSLNIPESSNSVPDILDEAKWNIDWMLTMQDPYDGGVYHKLTNKSFSGTVMPEDATATRYVVMKSTAATLDFCAVMAVASRVFADFETEFPGYSAQCLEAAEDAWAWALDNSAVQYIQPSDIGTGEYGGNSFGDEWDWAAAEMMITTGDGAYATETALAGAGAGTPSWGYVAPLAWISMALHINDVPSAVPGSIIQNKITSSANSLSTTAQSSAYRVAMGDANGNFVWGSNGHAGNQGMVLLAAYRLTGNENYLDGALANLDYLMGRNPTGYCFVTGMGDNSPMNIHHRPSAADGITNPVPGFIAGGPQAGQQDQCDGYPSNLRALSYLDAYCSYSTNEITINWNAPLAFLAGAAEFYRSDFANAAPSILIEPSDQSVQEGEDATFTVAASGPGTLTYQWYCNGQAIAGETGTSLTITSVDQASVKNYSVDVTNENGTTLSREVTIVLLVQEPYNASAHQIPGRIEAEEYDLGGAGLAYYDNGSTNQGGDYRVLEGVDIETAADVDGNYNVGWTDAGEWIEYTVEVTKSGTYDIDLRVASNTAGGTISLWMDSDKIVDQYTFAATGGWQDWATSTISDVFIMEGSHTLHFYIDADGFNINYMNYTLVEESDCNGDVGGFAALDACGICAGGNTGVTGTTDPGECAVGLQEDAEFMNIRVFPNPFEENTSIASDQKINRVDYYDLQGQLVFTEGRSQDIGHELPRGSYILKIYTDLGVVTRKALKR